MDICEWVGEDNINIGKEAEDLASLLEKVAKKVGERFIIYETDSMTAIRTLHSERQFYNPSEEQLEVWSLKRGRETFRRYKIPLASLEAHFKNPQNIPRKKYLGVVRKALEAMDDGEYDISRSASKDMPIIRPNCFLCRDGA